MRKMTVALVMAGLTACQPMREAEAPVSIAPSVPQDAANAAMLPSREPVATLSFVQAACGDCHGVESPSLSSNPESPTFEEIANRPGITKATLTAFLTDAHNYPEVMDFDLDKPRVENLVDYKLTMRRPDAGQK
ncbi:MAG: hypothetical protein WAT93_11595 [Pontixanthobacter sp.]